MGTHASGVLALYQLSYCPDGQAGLEPATSPLAVEVTENYTTQAKPTAPPGPLELALTGTRTQRSGGTAYKEPEEQTNVGDLSPNEGPDLYTIRQ